MSLKKRLNNIGSKIDPCATPGTRVIKLYILFLTFFINYSPDVWAWEKYYKQEEVKQKIEVNKQR